MKKYTMVCFPGLLIKLHITENSALDGLLIVSLKKILEGTITIQNHLYFLTLLV
jgi:hypothetical protein